MNDNNYIVTRVHDVNTWPSLIVVDTRHEALLNDRVTSAYLGMFIVCRFLWC